MSDIDSLIHRYLEDRASLASRELGELIAALRADPELAISLRDQLLLDDLLAQKLTLDRRNFVAQVEQRIADINRGHKELSQQTADLRSIAAAERAGASASFNSWRWAKFVLAISTLIVVAATIYATRSLNHHQPAIAKVIALVGAVTIEQNGESAAAEVGGSVESGQQIVVPLGGSMTLTYQDGTELRVKGDSAVTFGAEQPGAAKQIQIARGEVVATVKPQPAGPMRFTTPHAVAVAPVSILRLVVSDETVLDVSEGKVQLNRLADNRTLLVTASESGTASGDTLQYRKLTWPDRRDGLSYLYSPLESTPKENKPLTVARNPETRSLRVTPLELRGAATLSESRWFYELNGGYLISGDAGPDIFAASRGGSELTLEAIFSPASMDQSGPARIVALAAADDDEPDLALTQDGPDFTFCLKTDARPAPAPPPRMTISTADTPLHLTMTYRHGELIAYRDGMEIARSQDLLGSLAAWRSGPLTVGADASGERPWRGIMEALALYNRCLEPGEVARNARNYRLLAGRGM